MSKQNLSTLSSSSQQTMSSREIAKLCEKRHTHVISDIRKMLWDLELGEPKFRSSYKTKQNKKAVEFLLNQELTLTLVSGYNVQLRNKIIKRWQELEDKQAPQPVLKDPTLVAIFQTLQQVEQLKEETVAYAEDELSDAVSQFLDNAVQVAPLTCESPILRGKLFRFVKAASLLS